MKTTFFAFLLFVSPIFAQLNVRQIDRVVDVSQNSQVPTVEWYRGESVKFNSYLWRLNERVSLPDTALPVLKVWKGADLSVLYVNSTGTLLNAGSGEVSVSLTPAQANLPSNAYSFAMQLWDGTNYMGVAAAGTLRVIASPAGDSIPYVGTTRDNLFIRAPTNTWTPGYYLTSSDGGTTTYASSLNNINSNYLTKTDAALLYATNNAWATSTVASITGTSAARGEVTFAGVGVTQTGNVFNFSGGVGSITNIASSSARLAVTNGAGPEVGLSLDVSGLATGTPIYVEADPVWGAASTGYLTKVSAASLYTTGGAWNASVAGASNLAQTAYDVAAGAQATASAVFAGQDTTGRVTSASGDAGKYLKADGSWDTPPDTGFANPATTALEMGLYPLRLIQPVSNSPGNAAIELSITNLSADPWPLLRVSGGGYGGGWWSSQYVDFGLTSGGMPSNGYVLTYTATDSTWRAKAASGGGGDISALSNGLVNVGLTASNAYPRGGTSGLNWSAISNAPANITMQGTITAASIGAVPNTMTTNTVALFWNSSVPATTNDFIGFTYGSTLTTRSAGTNYTFATFVNAATNVYTATASADFSWPLLPTTVTSIELHHACISSTNASLVYEFANTDRGLSYITTQTVANTGLNITTNLTIIGTALTNAAPGQLWSVKVTGSGGCTNTANPAFFGPRTLFKVIGQ